MDSHWLPWESALIWLPEKADGHRAWRGIAGSAAWRGLGAALLFALFLTPGPTQAKPRVVELPYRSVDSYLLVEVKIDGSPVKLLVDTGSNTTIVNARSFCRTELMNLEELSKSFRIEFDGLLGQDILNKFRSVRIDYKRHVIELDE